MVDTTTFYSLKIPTEDITFHRKYEEKDLQGSNNTEDNKSLKYCTAILIVFLQHFLYLTQVPPTKIDISRCLSFMEAGLRSFKGQDTTESTVQELVGICTTMVRVGHQTDIPQQVLSMQ